jgi:hypothetical protein
VRERAPDFQTTLFLSQNGPVDIRGLGTPVSLDTSSRVLVEIAGSPSSSRVRHSDSRESGPTHSMSAAICSTVLPTAARAAPSATRARAVDGVALASRKGKVASAAPRLSARQSTASLRAKAPAGSAARGARLIVAAAGEDEKVPFGYTRADVLLVGFGTTAAGAALYYGLQANGVSAIWAGNIVQLTFVLGLSVAWVGSYVSRVMNKDMTYVKQLKDYEDAVMAKRLEELPEAELEKMMDDISKLDPK